MHLTHLTLRNFRNYRALDLELGPGLTVLAGDNAQGKSNLLEAIYLLALTKSHRAENDRETVRIQSLEERAVHAGGRHGSASGRERPAGAGRHGPSHAGRYAGPGARRRGASQAACG